MRFFLFGLLAFLFVFSLNNCANKTTPQGGPKDTLAPYVIQAIPKNQSTNYNGNTIILRFNEWITEKNLQQELLIAPPIKSYTQKIIRDRVEIRLQEPLRPNTTYSLNFRKGIADITEGNIAISDTAKRLPLRLAFSTGNFLDSLEVKGRVRMLMTNEPVKNAVVGLYDITDTLTIRKNAPYYFTQADENGDFRITNIKAGSYRLYAFRDADQNFTFQPTEFIGFHPVVLSLPDTNANKLQLNLFKDDRTPPNIQKSRAVGQDYEIVWSEYLREAEVLFPAGKETPYSFQPDRKTIYFYNPDAFKDSLQIKLRAIDSLGNSRDTLTKIAFKLPTEKSKKVKPAPLAFTIKSQAKDGFEKDVALDFVFEQPVKQAFLERIKALADNDTIKFIPLCQTDTFRHAAWNSTRTVLTVRRKAFFKERLTILADSGTFIGVRGDSSKTIRQTVPMKKITDYASISGSVRTDKQAFWLQLVNDKNEVVSEVANTKNFDFKYLPAGTYKIRVLIDENRNGVWDFGDLDKMMPPEPVLFFVLQNDGKLRDRWDLQGHTIVF